MNLTAFLCPTLCIRSDNDLRLLPPMQHLMSCSEPASEVLLRPTLILLVYVIAMVMFDLVIGGLGMDGSCVLLTDSVRTSCGGRFTALAFKHCRHMASYTGFSCSSCHVCNTSQSYPPG